MFNWLSSTECTFYPKKKSNTFYTSLRPNRLKASYIGLVKWDVSSLAKLNCDPYSIHVKSIRMLPPKKVKIYTNVAESTIIIIYTKKAFIINLH